MTDEAVDHLSIDDLLEVADEILDEVVVRDAGALAAAAAGRPQLTVFGDDAYPSLEEKAAALLHSLARNHPLLDGNERLAWSAPRVSYILNGRDLTYTVDDAERMVLDAAAGDIDVGDTARWIRDHRA